MIRLFVRLKLTLTKNLFRTSAGYGFVVFCVLATGFSFVGAMLLWRAELDSLRVLGPLLGAALSIGWIVGPVFYGSGDETIDTTKLAMFPLNARQATAGLGLASLVSPGPLAAIAPIAVFVARSPTLGSKSIGVAAAGLAVVLPVASSKLALTVLGAASNQRGRRDWATLAAGLGAAAVAVAAQGIVLLSPSLAIEPLKPVATALALTPFGWSGDALGRLTAGELLIPFFETLLSLATLVLVMRLWSTVLERALTEAPGSETVTEKQTHLLGRSSTLASHRYAPIMAKEFRYLRRDPRYRIQIVSQLVVLLVGGVPFVRAVIDRDPSAVLVGCIPALTTGITGTNLLGPDGRALWAEVLARDSLRDIIRGRALTFAIIGTLGALIVTLATAAYTGGWQYVSAALGAAIGFALVGSGVGSIVSVYSPAPYPEASNPNPFASTSPGRGCLTAIATFAGVIVGLLMAGPILMGLGLSRSSGLWLAATALISPIYGLGIWLLTTKVAIRKADRSTPELLEVFAAAP